MRNIMTVLVFIFLVVSCKPKPSAEPLQKTDIGEFTGQWTLDIQGGKVGWLEVRQETDYLDADLLWPTGGAIISDVFAQGPIYLQGDHGKVMYRNMVITPIEKQ